MNEYMEKNLNTGHELAEVREHCSNLTEKIEQQQGVIDYLLRGFSRMKILGYDFFTHWLLVILEILICTLGILQVCREGYPFWISLSFIYLIAITLLRVYRRVPRKEEYLNKIQYDLTIFWKDEDDRLHRKNSFKSRLRQSLVFIPILIHMGFVATYLHSIGRLGTLHDFGKYWWLVLIIMMVSAIVSLLILGKEYLRSVLQIFQEELR